MLWIETVWSLSVRLGFNLVIRRNSYTLCLISLLLRRFVFRKVRVERLVMSHKGPWEGSFPPSFARARETSGYEADVFHNSIWISVCFRLHNKAQYSPINLKHLHEFKIYILSVPLKFLFFKTSINAGTDYLKSEFAPNLLRGIKFKSAFLHWILLCNFSDQRLKIFQTFVE